MGANEVEFLRQCEMRKTDNGGKLKVVDINKKEKEIEVKELKSLSQVIEGLKEKFPGLVHWRVPVCNSAAPLETDFDIIVKTLLGTAINTPVIVNDQVGLSRATTGCVVACLYKEFQISASFEGLVETVPGVNAALLKTDKYVMDQTKDALFRGEFEVVKQLVSTLNDGAGAKNNADKIIDLNGTKKTGGTGIKQLRENIAESKLSYEIMDDAAQAFLKSKIMDNIQKYFYLIVFSGYIREASAAAREAIEADKKGDVALPASGKCSIPAKDLKIGKSFVDIYQTAHQMFSDMPQGDHKKRAKYRFASKTLMRILPADVKGDVEGLIEKGKMTLDLYEILGVCTWVEPAA